MFMLKKNKKPAVDTKKQMKEAAIEVSKIFAVFLAIRAASVFLNNHD